MFCYLFATMAIENSEEAATRIATDFVKVTMSVFHVWSVSSVLILGVRILFDT